MTFTKENAAQFGRRGGIKAADKTSERNRTNKAQQQAAGRARGRQLRFTPEGREHQRRAGKLGFRAVIERHGPEYFFEHICISGSHRWTSLELAVKDILDELGVLYLPKYKMEVAGHRYELDFLVADQVCIEADGQYWHQNRIFEDSVRDMHLAEAGIRTLRLGEDLIKDPYHCRAVIVAFLVSSQSAAGDDDETAA